MAMGDLCPLSGRSIAMSHAPKPAVDPGAEEQTARLALEFSGIALLLAAALFVIAGFLVLPAPF